MCCFSELCDVLIVQEEISSPTLSHFLTESGGEFSGTRALMGWGRFQPFTEGGTQPMALPKCARARRCENNTGAEWGIKGVIPT